MPVNPERPEGAGVSLPWLAALAPALPALLIAAADFVPPAAYPESEYLHPLIAGIWLGRVDFIHAETIPACAQNLNAAAAALCVPGILHPSLSAWFLPVAQIALYAMVLLRFRSICLRFSPRGEASAAVWLLALNPLFLYAAYRLPSMMLTLWLALEYVNSREGRPRWSGLALFLLGWCGQPGFFLAVFCAIGEGVAAGWAKFRSRAAILVPAAVFYFMQTVLAGIPFGAYLIEYPPLFAPPDWTSLWTGEWTRSLRNHMAWAANGFAGRSKFVPVFGFFALCGAIAAARDGLRVIWIVVGGIAVLFGLSGFHRNVEAMDWMVLALPAAALLAARGAFAIWDETRWRDEAFRACAGAAAVVPLALAMLDNGNADIRFRHLAAMRSTVSEAASFLADDETNALRFAPSVFLSAGTKPGILPVELAFRRVNRMEGGLSGGFRLTLADALDANPGQIVLFPTGVPEKPPSGPSDWVNFDSQTASRLNAGYALRRDRGLWIYERRDGAPAPVGSPGETTGLSWEFENGFGVAETVGFAFGGGPDYTASAEGAGSAGTGPESRADRLGILQSEPFAIEGGAMTMYANIPNASTATLVCLAVDQTIPFKGAAPTQRAMHIFEREPGDSLMGDTFYYIRPLDLRYPEGMIGGWRVVRIFHGGGPGWTRIEWSADPWINRKAVWLAADRDPQSILRIDVVRQHRRPPGLYWTFEDGTIGEWRIWGDAFGYRAATGPIGDQTTVSGFEGNYFINSYRGGSDAPKGILESPPFRIEWPRMSFRIGGGDNPETLYLGLKIGHEIVLRATGQRSETLRRVEWDLTPWLGSEAAVVLSDQASGPWGHLLADDIRLWREPSAEGY